MKYWLSGLLALLAASSSAWAENYRIVQSPSLKLDVWIDNIQDNTAKSWCTSELPLRIVANGEKKPEILQAFLPQVGKLLQSQCGTLNTLRWEMTAPDGKKLATGTAEKKHDWRVDIAPAAQVITAAIPPANNQRAEDLSPPADRTPWFEFNLKDGCRLRTFWQGGSASQALFIPAKDDGKCEKGGWLNGRGKVTQQGQNGSQTITMTFVHGFPVAGFNPTANTNTLLIASVNNERMVVSDERSPQSWLIMQYVPRINGWQVDGTVAVEMPRDQASDGDKLKARLDEVRKVWGPYLEPNTALTIQLVDAVHLQLKDPAAGAYHTLK
ncbi:hypothetical protein A9B99_06055 [Mangrovibacter phragmitis]|uniref:Type VI secretion system-associated protein n=1 Tax=Mangrovibacter phragmitis TaxID=1691903 RepID=A0A1B7L3N2_9ENTR|nr:hypothetical protein [Mangrovibacter phragmitis]OAT76878.1 hypothetical protein A9B99_06055 [Mangrovibacter phragmitis]